MILWSFFLLCVSVFPKLAGLTMLLFKMKGLSFFLMSVLL